MIIILALILIGGGTIYMFYPSTSNEQIDKEPKQEDTEEIPEIEIDQEAADHRVAKVRTITTPDEKIRFGTTSIYRSDNISGMTITITPYEDFKKVFLLLTMELPESNEEIVIHLENLKKKEQIEHEGVSLRDWTNVTGWSIKIITEDEAQKIWTSQKK